MATVEVSVVTKPRGQAGALSGCLATGPVGVRRSRGRIDGAPARRQQLAREALGRASEGARFALARALGKVGGPALSGSCWHCWRTLRPT